MTNNTDSSPDNVLFTRIENMAATRSASIQHVRNGNTLRLSFVDGQQIVINLDAQSHKVWLAWPAGGLEFHLHDDGWRTHDHLELFGRVENLIEHIFTSNPINASTPAPAKPQLSVTYEVENESHLRRNMLVIALSILLGFWAAQRWLQTQGNSTSAALSRMAAAQGNVPTQPCENGLPANGSVTSLAPNGLRANDPGDPEIILKNDHTYPLLFILTQPGTVIPTLSIFIHARQSTVVHLPAGQYGLMFGSGHTWCNSHSGFSDGHLVKLDKPMSVQPGMPLHLAMQSSGANAEDFQLFIKTTMQSTPIPSPIFSGEGNMEVRRQPNGHFCLPGRIADVPITFMVDTGATVTSISSDIARQAGIHDCKEAQFQTANGTATGCVALIPRMTLGNFVMENITVAVMPNLETNLLGSNILRNFQVRQDNNSMLIERR